MRLDGLAKAGRRVAPEVSPCSFGLAIRFVLDDLTEFQSRIIDSAVRREPP